ncbi:MAG: glycosyltransferase family A protein [Patescibacteria group bacterium]
MNQTISIIIPTYQHANTLVSCLDAIFAQTRKSDEVIVVDDGSQDNTQEVLKPYLDRIRVIVQTNQGAPTARNNGFCLSTGSFVLFCDADVFMQPNMLQDLELALIEHPEAAYAYSSFTWGWKLFSSFPFGDGTRLKQMNFIHTSALIRREAFSGFDPTIRRFQDWDLWLTMFEQGQKGQFVDRVLFHVMEVNRLERMSTWIPSFIIRLPWRFLGWKPKRVEKYDQAKQIILKKHGLL